jgi:prepilin-type N-terminal cleavage/methylation domain-containing protein
MSRLNCRARGCGKRAPTSFTLVELLTVMAIIAILLGLIISAGLNVLTKAARNRASAEIQAISSANESYKVDNGIYPQGDGNLVTNGGSGGTVYMADDGTTAGGEYQTNSTLLYIALTGQTNFATPPAAGTKVYLPGLKINQVGNPNGTFSYIADPWQHSYGYSTGTPAGAANTNYPYNGSGFFDLWSTGGIATAKVAANNNYTNTWISNWTQ